MTLHQRQCYSALALSPAPSPLLCRSVWEIIDQGTVDAKPIQKYSWKRLGTDGHQAVLDQASWDLATSLNHITPGLCMDTLESAAFSTGAVQTAELSALRESLRASLHNESVSVCSDVAQYCNDAHLVNVRALCPATCGCDTPLKGLFFNNAKQGCTVACQGEYRSQLASAPCTERNATTLADSQDWRYYFDGLAAFTAYMGNPLAGNHTREAAMVLGCGVVEWARGSAKAGAAVGTDLCDGSVGATLRPMCPHACGCEGDLSHPLGCPLDCSSRPANRTTFYDIDSQNFSFTYMT